MFELQADKLKRDPRINEAKALLRAALSDAQSPLKEVKASEACLRESYAKMLADYGTQRGGQLAYPYLSSGLGNGALVELADGSVKLDFIIGIGVHGFGHSDPGLLEALVDGALEDTVMQGNLQQGSVAVQLTDLLLGLAQKNGAPLDRCFISTTGAMANENALKMAMQKNAPAHRVLAFEGCFAGRTLAMAAVTDKAKYRDGLPLALQVDYLPFFDAVDPAGSTARCLSKLKELLHRYPGQYAMMLMELIQGERGYYPGDRDFFTSLMSLLREHNVAIVVDEVQSFGRSHEPFAFQTFGLDQYVDIVTVGKNTQICATLYRADYQPRPGLISQTFTSSSAAMHAAIYQLSRMRDEQFFGEDGRIAKLSERMRDHFIRMAEQYPDRVHGPFGYGGMLAFTPFDGQLKTVKAFALKLFENGLIGFLAGAAPVRMRFLLPIGVVTEAQIDGAAIILERTLAEFEMEDIA